MSVNVKLSENLVDQAKSHAQVQLSFSMQAGDIQVGNNYGILHSRTKYQDYADPAPKRHLLRTWLTLPNGRLLPQVFEETREFRISYLARQQSLHAE